MRVGMALCAFVPTQTDPVVRLTACRWRLLVRYVSLQYMGIEVRASGSGETISLKRKMLGVLADSVQM